MSAKFKPKKKETEAEVEDWDASGGSDEEDEVQKKLSGIRIGGGAGDRTENVKATSEQSVWGDDLNGVGRERKPISGRSLWEEANNKAPQAQPMIEGNRSLPTTLLAPRITSNTTGTGVAAAAAAAAVAHQGGGGNYQAALSEYDSRPPPQILRRDPNAAALRAGSNQDGSAKQKSIAEREEEYRAARERIFGKAAGGADGADVGGKRSVKPIHHSSRTNSRNGSGSDTGGRNSPSTGAKSTQNSSTKRR